MNNLNSPQLTLRILELESKQPEPWQVKDALEKRGGGKVNDTRANILHQKKESNHYENAKINKMRSTLNAPVNDMSNQEVIDQQYQKPGCFFSIYDGNQTKLLSLRMQ